MTEPIVIEGEQVIPAKSHPTRRSRPPARRKPAPAPLAAGGSITHTPPPPPAAPDPDLFWHSAPLATIQARLSDMKREYDRVAQIVIARQSYAPRVLECWAWLNRTDTSRVPPRTSALCRRQIPDGKWVFRDDGVFSVRNGVRVATPAVCCSQECFTAYQQAKTITALSRH